MEVHDPPNQTRYVKQSRILAAGQTDFLSISPATGLQKLKLRVADQPDTMGSRCSGSTGLL
jgi:hypothetical protein